MRASVPGNPTPDDVASPRVNGGTATSGPSEPVDHAPNPAPAGDESPVDGHAAGRSAARWWIGVAGGLLVSLPLSWLLSYAAALPFFLGLFFFALFGLVIGAVVHRIASPGRPYPLSVVLAGTILIISVGWGISLVTESRGLPWDLAKEAANRTRDLEGRTHAEYISHVAGEIRGYLSEHYPPGGTIGYVRWVFASGEFKKGHLDGVQRTLRQPQRKWWWVMRVVLSIALFAFGIGSQTWLLRLRADPAGVRAIDRRDHPTEGGTS